MSSVLPEVFLIRHGETAWTTTGRMTGNVDLPLTPRGESEAKWIEDRLRGIGFHRVFVSPRIRARRTAEIAGLVARAEVDPDLVEWDYGRYQGRRLDEVPSGPAGRCSAMAARKASRWTTSPPAPTGWWRVCAES